MTPGCRIRAGEPRDAAEIQALHRRAILAVPDGAYRREEIESWAAEQPLARYLSAMTDGGEQFLVGTAEGGALAAFCCFKGDEVRGLYVDPAWVGQGLGRKLLAGAERIMRLRGVPEVWLWASLNARRFYERQGYAVVAEGTLETRGGLIIAVVQMTKSLGV
jgi:GNAT superfamily N-acetyltransferase